MIAGIRDLAYIQGEPGLPHFDHYERPVDRG